VYIQKKLEGEMLLNLNAGTLAVSQVSVTVLLRDDPGFVW